MMFIFWAAIGLARASGSSNVDSKSNSTRTSADFQWTDALRAAAKPMPQKKFHATDVLNDGRPVTCSTSHCTAASVSSPNFKWTPELRAEAKPKKPPSMQTLPFHNSTISKNCPLPARITDFASVPASLIGRILFQDASGDSYICSGAFVADYNMVLTAGHCCYTPAGGAEPSGWHKNWEVTLGYDHGGGRHYAASKATCNTAWSNDHDWTHDYCMLTMKDEGPGYLGWMAGFDPASYMKAIDAYGYPANFGGNEELYVAHGSYSSANLNGRRAAQCLQTVIKCMQGTPVVHGGLIIM